MASASIPGLDIGPVDEATGTAEVSGIELMSFKCEPYIVPAPHGFGKCRLITEFEKLSYIGEGTFGSVYKVKDKKYDRIVALKKLKIGKDAGVPVNFSREINCLKLVEHENIANLLGVAVGRVFESTYLVLEFCPYDLSKALDEEAVRSEMNHSHIKSIMYQLFTGLQVLHDNFVVHRNLSMSSILFSEEGVLKITDFSSSRQFTKWKMTPKVVSRCYTAPELLFGAEIYTSAIDIWSAGCILAELLLKRPLFKSESDCDMISSIVELLGTPSEAIWPGCMELPLLKNYTFNDQPHNKVTLKFAEQATTCIALLHKIFIYNPSKRTSAEKCLVHSYFTDKPLACSLDSLVAVLKKVNEI